MKSHPLFPAALLTLVFLAGCSKSPSESTATPKASVPAAGAAATDAQLFEAYGWYVGSKTGVAELGLAPAELEALLKGFRIASGGQPSPYDFTVLGPKLDELLGKRAEAAGARLREKNTAEGVAFFAKLKDNKNVTFLPSGLGVEVLTPAAGPAPKPTDTVRVHYEGRFIDGTVFDSSLERGQPAEFALNAVIPGWTEGLQQTGKGGKVKLYVPSKLAYGDDGRPGMPPASTLIFEVELLEINPTAPAAPAAPVAK